MAVYDTVKLTVESCFLLFHASILFCIVHEKWRKNAKFDSPFFSFYVLQSLFDMMFVLCFGVCIGLANFGVFVPFINVGLALSTYGHLAQGVAHALISYNRYTAIVQPHKNKEIWTRRRRWMYCALVVLLPLPVVCVKLRVQYKLVIVAQTGAYKADYSNELFATIAAFLVTSYCAISALVSFVFELTTFVVYKRLSSAAQLKYRDDYKLLLYALSQLVGQLLSAFCSSSVIVRAFVNFPAFMAIVPVTFHITVDIIGLSGPVCLLVTSKHTRSSYFRMMCGGSKFNEVHPQDKRAVVAS